MKYKMVLSYDGTGYGGWQTQPNTRTIQETVEKVLGCSIVGSGRTDAGVHAEGQVAHFELRKAPMIEEINRKLPEEIRIKEIALATEDFHARYSVKRKIYHYHLRLSVDEAPLNSRYATRVFLPLDLKRLKKALPYLLGTHDFSAFRGSLCGSKNPIKTLHRLEMAFEEGGIRLEFEGDGFLYKMVRNIVGTLLEVASHKREIEDLRQILESKDRKRAGQTAPPQGLFLQKVIY